MNLSEFLLEKAHQFNNLDFIEHDPISIPHKFSLKQDIEISALLVSTIAWGNRKSIINSSNKMMNYLENNPYDFILNHTKTDLDKIPNSIHRTFSREDFVFFITSLKNIYSKYVSLEEAFVVNNHPTQNYKNAIIQFREIFFNNNEKNRTQKHLGNPLKNSSCKRINMFLRWMVRKDNKGVDFGIWNKLSPMLLSCPLDVHSGNVARKLGLLKRTVNDWKAVEELDIELRKINPTDPVLLDFALFGLGVNKELD